MGFGGKGQKLADLQRILRAKFKDSFWFHFFMTKIIFLVVIGVKSPKIGYPKNILRAKKYFDPLRFVFWGT